MTNVTRESGNSNLFIEVLTRDRLVVSYRPEIAKYLGSVTGAILLQQVIYRWDKNGRKPFYKFKQACEHQLYRDGDSWCEELAFGRHEFDGALKKIAQKVKKGGVKDSEVMVYYWTGIDRVTYYDVNIAALRKVGNRIYEESETGFIKSGKPDLDITEITTKKNYKECEERAGNWVDGDGGIYLEEEVIEKMLKKKYGARSIWDLPKGKWHEVMTDWRYQYVGDLLFLWGCENTPRITNTLKKMKMADLAKVSANAPGYILGNRDDVKYLKSLEKWLSPYDRHFAKEPIDRAKKNREVILSDDERVGMVEGMMDFIENG